MILQRSFLFCLTLSATTGFSPWTTTTTRPTSATTKTITTSRFLQASSQQDIELVFDQHTPQSLPESDYTPILIADKSLLPIATQLRKRYDEHFQDPRQPNENRFVWDPWFVLVGDGRNQQQHSSSSTMDNDDDNAVLVPGEAEAARQQIQYSLKRIPASSLFDDSDDEKKNNLYETLIDDLTDLASSIGLTAMSPPWVSLYTEGDMQNYHTDAPHGPMAFVLSLSREGDFCGGETMLLNPKLLDYWRGFDGSQGVECGSIVRFIPPAPLGRCIVFDPRIPHGVNRVTGTQDPRKGRIAVHGWFNEPQVCWFGPWNSNDNPQQQQQLLDSTLESVVETLGTGEIGRVMGYLAVRIQLDMDGEVQDVVAVCDTLQADWEDFRGIIGYDEEDRPIMEDAVSDVRLTIMEALQALEFGKAEEEGRAVVVPFLFE